MSFISSKRYPIASTSADCTVCCWLLALMPSSTELCIAWSSAVITLYCSLHSARVNARRAKARCASASASNMAVLAVAASSTARYDKDRREDDMEVAPSRIEGELSPPNSSCMHSIGGRTTLCFPKAFVRLAWRPSDIWHSSCRPRMSCFLRSHRYLCCRDC